MNPDRQHVDLSALKLSKVSIIVLVMTGFILPCTSPEHDGTSHLVSRCAGTILIPTEMSGTPPIVPPHAAESMVKARPDQNLPSCLHSIEIEARWHVSPVEDNFVCARHPRAIFQDLNLATEIINNVELHVLSSRYAVGDPGRRIEWIGAGRRAQVRVEETWVLNIPGCQNVGEFVGEVVIPGCLCYFHVLVSIIARKSSVIGIPEVNVDIC